MTYLFVVAIIALALFISLNVSNYIEANLWELAKVQVLQEGSKGGKIYLLIAGFNQPTSSWQDLVDGEVFKPHDRVLALPRRFNELVPGRHWLYPLAWVGFDGQTTLAIQCIKVLINNGQIPKHFWVIGHSVGAGIAQSIAEALPNSVIGLTLANSPPHERFKLTTNWSFWHNGGLLALIPATLGLLRITWGFKPWSATVRGLYTGQKVDNVTLRAYQADLLADSPAAFIGLLFFYKGGALKRAREKGFNGPIHYVICPGDTIFRADDIRVSAQMEPRGEVHELASTTPHCFQFETDPEAKRGNYAILRQAIGGDDPTPILTEDDNVIPITKKRAV